MVQEEEQVVETFLKFLYCFYHGAYFSVYDGIVDGDPYEEVRHVIDVIVAAKKVG